jgi:hypothetical protein
VLEETALSWFGEGSGRAKPAIRRAPNNNKGLKLPQTNLIHARRLKEDPLIWPTGINEDACLAMLIPVQITE